MRALITETGLCDEAEFEFGQTDDVIPLLPVPGWDVQEVGLGQKQVNCSPRGTTAAIKYFKNISCCGTVGEVGLVQQKL